MDKRSLVVVALIIAVGALAYFFVSKNAPTALNVSDVEPMMEEMAQKNKEAEEATTTVQTPPTQAPAAQTTPAPTQPVPKVPASSTPKNSVVIGETKTGNGINVESVTLDTIGYVVVYRVNSNGESKMIGRTEALSVGTHRDITVRFSTVIAREQTIVAVLHGDDGDIVFEFPESDSYLTTAEGAIIADIDVVDIDDTTKEAQALERQVEAFLESFDPEVN